ncbi:hypothetical protein NKI82_33015 [Mesorhizobium sp. M0482]
MISNPELRQRGIAHFERLFGAGAAEALIHMGCPAWGFRLAGRGWERVPDAVAALDPVRVVFLTARPFTFSSQLGLNSSHAASANYVSS